MKKQKTNLLSAKDCASLSAEEMQHLKGGACCRPPDWSASEWRDFLKRVYGWWQSNRG